MRYTGMIWALLVIAIPAAATDVLFESGPLINSPGTGVGGADESIVLTSLGMRSLGFGQQKDPAIDNRVADDFTVADGEMWDITMITTFAYQRQAPSSGSIDGVFIEVWDGVPGVSNLIWGSLDTNYLMDSAFTNVYRVLEVSSGTNTERAIMANQSVPAPDLLLAAGTYYMAWQSDGDRGLSGPFANPIAETDGDAITGNGLLSLGGGPYDPALDVGSLTQQGFPFILEGDRVGGTPILETSWGSIKATFAE